MTLALAVDTTADAGSIALADDASVREEVPLHAPRGFSHVLFGEIDALLKRHGVMLTDIGLFAGAAGPGSFTGVRIGLSAIKGLAEVLGKRAIAISNLEVLAAFGTSGARAPVIDARRGEVYAAVYDDTGTPLVPQCVLPFDKFLELIAGRGFDPLKLEWISQGFELPASYRVIPAPESIAGRLAQLAIRQAAAGLTKDPAAIDANYVRRSDAELLWKGH